MSHGSCYFPPDKRVTPNSDEVFSKVSQSVLVKQILCEWIYNPAYHVSLSPGPCGPSPAEQADNQAVMKPGCGVWCLETNVSFTSGLRFTRPVALRSSDSQNCTTDQDLFPSARRHERGFWRCSTYNNKIVCWRKVWSAMQTPLKTLGHINCP